MTVSNCRRVSASLDDYRTGSVSEEERREIDRHLESCPTCRRMHEREERLRSALGDIEPDPMLRRRLEIAVAARRKPDVRGRRGRLGIIAAAAMAAAVTVALFFHGDYEDENGRGIVARASDARATAASVKTGEPIHGTSIQGAGRLIEVSEHAVLWLGAGSSVWIRDTVEDDVLVHLESGFLVAEVGPREPGARFVVTTPVGEVEARGTVFSVEVEPGRCVRARVVEGVVEARSSTAAVTVSLVAGEELVLGDPVPSLASMDDLERDRCLVPGCPEREIETDADIAVTVSKKEPVEQTNLGGDSRNRVRLAALAIKERRLNDAARLVDDIARENPQGAETVELLSRLARAYRANRRFGDAVSVYQRLIARYPASDAAVNGLVALAQIEKSALGRPRAALGHFGEYLELRPRGFLAEAARAGRVRTFRLLGQQSALVRAADEYIGMYPSGPSAPEVIKLRAKALDE